MATEALEKTPLTEAVGGHPHTEIAVPHTGNVAVRFVKLLAREAWADSIDDVGAMLTYYAILALFPMMVFIVTLALLVLDTSTVQQGVAMATETMPATTRELIAGRADSFVHAASPGFAIGSALFALWGASRGAVALMGALNAMFDKQETRSWVRRQLIAIGVTLAVAVVMVVALAILVLGPAVGHWLGFGATFDTIWQIGRWVGAGLLAMMLWALLYKLLPNTNAPFRVFTPGAVVGVLLWLGIGYLFGVYLSYFDRYETLYGAFGTGIIFLTWLWLSNVALLLGAEINDVLADLRKERSPGAAKLADTHESM